MSFDDLTAGGLATLACLMEVAAPKPGNVHRGADFPGTTFYDFQTSAVLLGQAIDRTADRSTGETILECVKANHRVVKQNTNLGMILLLVPLAKALLQGSLDSRTISTLLSRLNGEDCANVYQAISLAAPGGLGESSEMDVAGDTPPCLLTAMQAAEGRDLVARQYSRNFETVFDCVEPCLVAARKQRPLHEAIVVTHVQMMAKYPDSLIARKCGIDIAAKSQVLAKKCVDAIDSRETFLDRVGELDYWLRSDGNRRNPGTTADLIAAGLFVAMANGRMEL